MCYRCGGELSSQHGIQELRMVNVSNGSVIKWVNAKGEQFDIPLICKDCTSELLAYFK